MRHARNLLALFLAFAALAGHGPARADDDKPAPQGAQLLDARFAAAFVANDVDAIVDLYAEDAVLFNLGGPPAVGRAQIRTAIAGFLSAFQVTAFQHLSPRYTTEDGLSTGWAEFTITVAPRAGGPAFTIRGRSTTVARKMSGRWYYVHDHASVPQS